MDLSTSSPWKSPLIGGTLIGGAAVGLGSAGLFARAAGRSAAQATSYAATAQALTSPANIAALEQVVTFHQGIARSMTGTAGKVTINLLEYQRSALLPATITVADVSGVRPAVTSVAESLQPAIASARQGATSNRIAALVLGATALTAAVVGVGMLVHQHRQ
jgi:hypothetical protein